MHFIHGFCKNLDPVVPTCCQALQRNISIFYYFRLGHQNCIMLGHSIVSSSHLSPDSVQNTSHWCWQLRTPGLIRPFPQARLDGRYQSELQHLKLGSPRISMYIMTDSRDFRGEIAFQLCDIQSFENCMFFLQLFQTWSRCLMSYHTTPVSFCNLTRHQRRQGLSQGCWGDFVSPPGTVWAIRPSKTDGEIWNNTTASANIPAMNMNISGQNCKNRDFFFQNSPPILPCWDFTVKPFAPLLRYPFPQDLGTIHHTSSHQFCRWLYQLHSFRIASQWVLFDCLSTQMTH